MSVVGKVCTVLAIISIFYIISVLLFFIIEILKDAEDDRRWRDERERKKEARKQEILDMYSRIPRERGDEHQRHGNK